MILTAFIEDMRDLIYGDAITMPTHIALGTGTTAVTAADTTLETETERHAAANGKSNADTVTYSATWSTAEGNGDTFTEVGAVNAASAGTLANRQVFPGFLKTVDYELRVQVYIKNEDN